MTARTALAGSALALVAAIGAPGIALAGCSHEAPRPVVTPTTTDVRADDSDVVDVDTVSVLDDTDLDLDDVLSDVLDAD